MYKKNQLLKICYAISLGSSYCAYAQTDTQQESGQINALEEVFITGGQERLRTLAGSGSFLDGETIAQFDSTDINDLISQVPGVYIRFEDGYGLRPNIGIRGATSDRSQKLTIMEDGILITPTPYSAPAAYYFPNVNRMEAVEVVKGPSAIKHGPHTIGGAVNLVTRPVKDERQGEFGITYGSDNFQKYRAFYGDSGEQWGYWVDALHYGADGFKELDNGADTGFERNDFNAKIRWRSKPDAEIQQQLVVKIGYADEDSDETYLGLTDSDFALTPNRRYAASQLDGFDSDHEQLHVLHSVDFNNDWSLFTRAYVQRFSRAWNRFDGFVSSGPGQAPIAAIDVLSRADAFPGLISLLRGDISSNGNRSLVVDVTNNDRDYGSRGISFNAQYDGDIAGIDHILEFGVRFHHDYIERNHTFRGYFVEDGVLVFDGVEDRQPKDLNEARTDALALFINDEFSIADLKVNIGVRYENIEGEFDDSLNNVQRERSQDVITPGIGMHYQLSDNLGLLAGIYKGFSPAGPSSDDSVDPEEAVNYEYGLRYDNGTFTADVIGFFSDYSNLIGRCRASDSGCNDGDEFNGGEVEVSGVEVTSHYAISLGQTLSLPIDLTYTYTESAFQSSFQSSFSQWGVVNKGDRLPYLPENQLRLQVGIESANWSVTAAAKYIDELLEVPGQGALVEGQFTPSYTTYDLAADWQLTERFNVQLIAENIGDKQVIVARRPFGARPNQPRIVKAGVTYKF